MKLRNLIATGLAVACLSGTAAGGAEVAGVRVAEGSAMRSSSCTEPDRYALTYVPGVGTELARNGQRLGLIEGADFSSALFAIWLGDRAFDASLRGQLLGTS